MTRILGGWAAVVLIAGAAWAAEKLTKAQLEARFYYDLGSAEVDVSKYPVEQQANYVHFEANCSLCHTQARPLNSPLVARKDWARYVKRMHLKSKVHFDRGFEKNEGKGILDFLAYDSNLRKVEHKAEFEAQTARLKELFEEIKKERMRLQIEADKKKVKPMPLDGGVKPQP